MKEPTKLNRNVKQPRRPRHQVSWQDIPEHLIRDFVVACEGVGVGVVLGRTLNGSSLSVVCLDGAAKPKDYIGTPDDAIPVLEGLLWAVDADVPPSLQMEETI